MINEENFYIPYYALKFQCLFHYMIDKKLRIIEENKLSSIISKKHNTILK